MIAALAQNTVEGLPQPFRDHASAVVLRVVNWPSENVLADLGIDDRRDLTGLYDGTPLTRKCISDPDPLPDIVWLYREPILQELRERPGITLAQLVTHVVIHEFAHHFGWSDDDIAVIDRWWE